MITISTHTGHRLSQLHNIRDENHTAKDGHIDPSKSHLNEIIRHEPIQDAYHRLFDEAVKEYNAKQKRDDRKIKDYYQKIKKSKQQYVAYEMCAGVYNKTGDNGVVDEARREFDDELGKTIMMEYALGFPERNPNLEVVGIYYHADEVGQPAMHITYIPVAYDCKRGLSTQTGLDKALQQQSEAFRKKEAVYEYERNKDGSYKLDDKGKKIKKLGDDGKPIQISEWTTPQILWEARENQILEAICNKYGLSVEHPDRDAGGRRHQQTAAYKKSKDEQRALEKEIAQQREAAEQERQQHEDNLLRIAADAEAAEEKKAKAEKAAEQAAQQKKEAEDELELQRTIIENQKNTILENEEILQETDPDGVLEHDKWLIKVINAVKWAFPDVSPLIDKMVNLCGKKEPQEVAEIWDRGEDPEDLVEERDTAGKESDGNER